MKQFSLLIVLSLILLSVVGLVNFGMMETGHQHFCPVSSLSGTDCYAADLLAATHHLAGLNSLTQAVFSSLLLLALIFFSLSLLKFVPALRPFRSFFAPASCQNNFWPWRSWLIKNCSLNPPASF